MSISAVGGGRTVRNIALAAAVLALAAAAFVALTDSAERNDIAARQTDGGAAVAAQTPIIALDVQRRSATVRSRQHEPTETRAEQPPQPPTRSQTAGVAAPEIDAAEYIAALRASGETEGIAAFNPPGTRPVQAGVVVPEDYELPEGYVRHYQTTDDGRRLAAILTLSPDYDLFDENGNPIPLSQDRIVPPEFAPPDLPIRVLELPDSSNRSKGSR